MDEYDDRRESEYEASGEKYYDDTQAEVLECVKYAHDLADLIIDDVEHERFETLVRDVSELEYCVANLLDATLTLSKLHDEKHTV